MAGASDPPCDFFASASGTSNRTARFISGSISPHSLIFANATRQKFWRAVLRAIRGTQRACRSLFSMVLSMMSQKANDAVLT
jgi:hypothetical protein